jgi:ribosomal protein S18 acetylase RimI-like enzyme
MTDWLITPHVPAELEAIAALVNSAYRGESARAGWAHEADHVGGQRTSAADLAADLTEPGRALLVLRREASGEILACVLVERIDRPHGGVAAYIGMLTVKPTLQDSGLGRVMLAAAEDFARELGADRARMTVVSIRDTLIAWYQRRGYALTGERQPFPYGDERIGVPMVEGLEFVVMEKALSGG